MGLLHRLLLLLHTAANDGPLGALCKQIDGAIWNGPRANTSGHRMARDIAFMSIGFLVGLWVGYVVKSYNGSFNLPNLPWVTQEEGEENGETAA